MVTSVRVSSTKKLVGWPSQTGLQVKSRSGFWLMNSSEGVSADTFAAFGNRWQFVLIVPSRGDVIVRRGEDPAGAGQPVLPGMLERLDQFLVVQAADPSGGQRNPHRLDRQPHARLAAIGRLDQASGGCLVDQTQRRAGKCGELACFLCRSDHRCARSAADLEDLPQVG